MISIQRKGFTLVEIMVVVAIVALMAAAASWASRLPIAQNRRELLIAGLRSLDATARQRSGSDSSPISLRISPTNGLITLTDRSDQPLANPIEIGKGIELGQVLGARKRPADIYEVGFDRFGTSRSYALGLTVSGGGTRWLVMLGMTGQSYILDDTETVREVLSRRHE